MNTLERIEHWADDHHPLIVDYGRVLLGTYIFLKGIFFLQNWEVLFSLVESFYTEELIIVLVHYIAFAHLAGGLFIAIGLATRMSILFQLPILLGAVFMVNLSNEAYGTEWWASFIVLIGLIVYLIYGSGKFSADTWINNHPTR